MSEAVLVILISSGLTLVGTIITVVATNKKTTAELLSKIEVLTERVNSQKESIDKHNNFGLRIPVLEEQVKSLRSDVDDLKRSMNKGA